MKITLKTLKQQTFVVEVDMEKDTVLSLKEKLCIESGHAYPAERQRLIYLGKIMEDEQLLSQYDVDDKKFIVVMNKKPDPPLCQATSEGATPAKESKTAKDTKTEDPAALEPNTATDNVNQSKPSSSSSTTSATEQKKIKDVPKTTEDKEEQERCTTAQADMQDNIKRIIEMGYSEQSARIALEIGGNHTDRAVEYLLSGMAGEVESEITLGAGISGSVTQAAGEPGTTGPNSTSTANRDGNPLAFLRNHPVFQDMKLLLQEDPNLLPHLMHRIQTGNPDLMRIIANHQEEFLALINEPQQNPMSQELEDIAAAMVNSLTPSDMDAIDRLKALGYPEHLVIQAYIACERNEFNAAEFLVSQTLDEEE